jgi:molybdenum cofactor cytidylyltransferase
MGTSKQLLRLGSKSVIRHCVDTLADAGIGQVVVVCGAGQEGCVKELTGTGARIVWNEAKGSQMADSVRVGLRAVDETCPAVLVCLADHPLVTSSTYQAIIDAHQQSPERIIIPAFEGRRGHPSLFPFPVISDIFFQPTLRDLISEEGDRVLVVDVPDEGVVLDMDTEEEYRIIVDKFVAYPENERRGEKHVQRE